MADQTGKIQVQGEGDIDVTKGSAADNDNIEITDTGRSAKKTGANEIELSAKLNLPDTDKNNQLLTAAAVAAALAANDNVENEKTEEEEVASTQAQMGEMATPLATEMSGEEPPKPAESAVGPTPAVIAPSTAPVHQADRMNQGAERAEEKRQNAKEGLQPTVTPPDNNVDRIEEGAEEAEKERAAAKIEKQPPTVPTPVQTNESAPAPTENRPKQTTPPVLPAAPAPNIPSAPTVPDEALGQVGPHNLDNKTPATLPTNAQSQVGNELSANQAQNRNFGQRLGDNIGNKIQQGVQNVKNAPRNIIDNIKSNFESDRSRTRQIRQERRQLESELSKLEGRLDGVKASGPMRIIRFWFPGIYASISGFGAGIANAKGEAKVAMLQGKLLTAETIKGTLKAAEGISALIEANIKVLSWIVETSETIILPILLIVTYPIAVLLIWIYIEFMGALGAPITKSIKELVKQVDIIIENLQKILEPEKQKIKIRRNIQFLNQMLASKDARKNMDKSPQPTTNTNPSLGGPAANDNIEQTNYQQAA